MVSRQVYEDWLRADAWSASSGTPPLTLALIADHEHLSNGCHDAATALAAIVDAVSEGENDGAAIGKVAALAYRALAEVEKALAYRFPDMGRGEALAELGGVQDGPT